jgi:hypothetical protein
VPSRDRVSPQTVVTSLFYINTTLLLNSFFI